MQMHPMLSIAIRAARAAGSFIVRHFDRVDKLTITKKRYNELVTEVDHQAEQIIIDTLLKFYPGHDILAEESGSRSGADLKDGFVWIIDPLDGTTNFIHGFPQFSVSIALAYRGRLEQSVVYDLLRDELYTATRGEGAKLNDRRIRVSTRKGLADALLGTGFPHQDSEHLDAYLSLFKDFLTQSAGVRRSGSAAIDLASVAAGRFDGFWLFGLEPWDMAAGALLIQEAGGMVSDLNGDGDYLTSGNIVAGSPKVYEPMMETIQPYRRFFN